MDFLDDYGFLFFLGVLLTCIIFLIINGNNQSKERLVIINSDVEFQKFSFCEKIDNFYYCK